MFEKTNIFIVRHVLHNLPWIHGPKQAGDKQRYCVVEIYLEMIKMWQLWLRIVVNGPLDLLPRLCATCHASAQYLQVVSSLSHNIVVTRMGMVMMKLNLIWCFCICKN